MLVYKVDRLKKLNWNQYVLYDIGLYHENVRWCIQLNRLPIELAQLHLHAIYLRMRIYDKCHKNIHYWSTAMLDHAPIDKSTNDEWSGLLHVYVKCRKSVEESAVQNVSLQAKFCLILKFFSWQKDSIIDLFSTSCKQFANWCVHWNPVESSDSMALSGNRIFPCISLKTLALRKKKQIIVMNTLLNWKSWKPGQIKIVLKISYLLCIILSL